ncbi:MAG: hypothetical protein OCD02_15440 [Spirochaetaceae bacterium]
MEIEDSDYKKIKEKYNPFIPPLKKMIKRSGFINYLFFHRSKIIKWNNNSDLILFKYLGLKVMLAEDFKNRLDMIFYNDLFKLSNHLNILIARGWKMNFISIQDYNILINFKNLYDRFYQVARSGDIIKQDFLNLERAYIKIIYRQSYIDAVISVFEKYLITNNNLYIDQPEKYDVLMNGLKHLFAKSSLPHSLRELILAYNITSLQGFYRWGELFPPISTEVVQSEWYNCDREVYTNLINYYKEIKKSTKSLTKDRNKLLRLKNNCVIDKDIAPPILVNFYERENHNWELDNSSYYLQFLVIVGDITKHFDQFILEEWEMMNEREELIKQRLIRDDELPSLHRKLKREVDMAFVIFNADTGQTISVTEYRSDSNPISLIKSEQQKNLFSYFEVILDTLYDISFGILGYGDLAIESGYTKNSYLNFMLVSPELWMGKPIFSIFNYYVELIWTICGYFNHKDFKYLDENLVEIETKLQEMESEMNRIDTFKILDKTVAVEK